jgi:hypothetical protein
MAIPSGTGTEVLKRMSITRQDTTATKVDWAQAVQTDAGNSSGTTAVPANKILTILSIFLHLDDTGAKNFTIYIEHSGETTIFLFQEEAVPAKGTFVVNDKIILHPADVLVFDASGARFDILINFIEQDWT